MFALFKDSLTISKGGLGPELKEKRKKKKKKIKLTNTFDKISFKISKHLKIKSQHFCLRLGKN
jgi:hypothetical protein